MKLRPITEETKQMEYYVLTESGRQSLKTLKLTQSDKETDVLNYLSRAGSATLEQIAHAIHSDDIAAEKILKSMIANRWIWVNTKKASSF